MSRELKLAYTIPEAVEASGISRRTLYNFLSTRELPHIKVGSRTLIRVEDLKSFLDSRIVTTPPSAHAA